MITKKYYVQFADMIAKRKAQYTTKSSKVVEKDFIYTGIEILQNDMIQLFKSDNPNFNETRFNQHIENKVKSLLE